MPYPLLADSITLELEGKLTKLYFNTSFELNFLTIKLNLSFSNVYYQFILSLMHLYIMIKFCLIRKTLYNFLICFLSCDFFFFFNYAKL